MIIFGQGLAVFVFLLIVFGVVDRLPKWIRWILIGMLLAMAIYTATTI